MPVLDQHRAGAIQQHAARRAQRQRPLMVVLGQFLVALVLDHLEEPEAHPQDGEHDDGPHLQRLQAEGDAAAIFGYRHGNFSTCSPAHSLGRRDNRRRSIAPGRLSITENATMPMIALPSDCVVIAASGDANERTPSTW